MPDSIFGKRLFQHGWNIHIINVDGIEECDTLKRQRQRSVQKVSSKPSAQTLIPRLVIIVSSASVLFNCLIISASSSGLFPLQCTNTSIPTNVLFFASLRWYIGIINAVFLS